MREINHLIIHCSATKPDMDVGVAEIRDWHVNGNGWRDVGYNYIITRDGTVQNGRDIDRDGNVDEEVGAHAKGFNSNSIGICLIGGINSGGDPDSNFTILQYGALYSHVVSLTEKYGSMPIVGHRDLPGVTKACPSFDVKSLFQHTELEYEY